MAVRCWMIACAAAGALAVVPLAANSQVPASIEQKVQTLEADLKARGYEVTRGQ